VNGADFQKWLTEHGQVIPIDGLMGPKTRAAIAAAFTNPCAASITEDEIIAFANRLGCTTRQLKAVATVESSASGFDRLGRPKILFERHLFWRYTRGIFGKTPSPGRSSGCP
jgi:hypothetical protein